MTTLYRNLNFHDKFTIEGDSNIYEKVEPNMISCCKQKDNSIRLSDNERVLIALNQQVTKWQESAGI